MKEGKIMYILQLILVCWISAASIAFGSFKVDPQIQNQPIAPEKENVICYPQGNTKICYPETKMCLTPTPTPVATPAPSTPQPKPKVALKPGVEPWRGLVGKYFPASEIENALSIMSAESGGNPDAISPTKDLGLMQINAVHADRVGGDLSRLFDPEVNLRVAYEIWSEQSWHPWSTAKKLNLD